ncbi:hypothetical protein SAFG77S_10041 [Streptomyces afghaniensis]
MRQRCGRDCFRRHGFLRRVSHGRDDTVKRSFDELAGPAVELAMADGRGDGTSAIPVAPADRTHRQDVAQPDNEPGLDRNPVGLPWRSAKPPHRARATKCPALPIPPAGRACPARGGAGPGAAGVPARGVERGGPIALTERHTACAGTDRPGLYGASIFGRGPLTWGPVHCGPGWRVPIGPVSRDQGGCNDANPGQRTSRAVRRTGRAPFTKRPRTHGNCARTAHAGLARPGARSRNGGAAGPAAPRSRPPRAAVR